MNRLFILLLVALTPFFADAQIITTVAGSGFASGFSGDGGAATAAVLSKTFGLARDASGNIYVADVDNSRVRKIDTSGIISTFAGIGGFSYSGGGGPATAAGLSGPVGLAFHGGNLYLTDNINYRIRKVDASGMITTIAGTGTNGYSGDGGAATAAKISRSHGIAIDTAGNVYIADFDNDRIRKIDASGAITTIAGNGMSGYSGDGGPATAAKLNGPDDMKIDGAGNLYVCDIYNNAIRKITASGTITTFAGTGVSGFSGDGGPATAAKLNGADGVYPDTHGNVYIADADNHRIRMVNTAGIITTVAGTGVAGFGGDGGLATAALLNRSNDMAMDGAGNLYFCDIENHRVRKISPAPGDVDGGSLFVVPIEQIQLSIYPNPANELLTIKSSAIITSVTIINTDGKIVRCGIYNAGEVHMSIADLPAGVYIANINGKETREFIKE